MSVRGTAGYAAIADRHLSDTLSLADKFAPVLDWLPEGPMHVADIGAGGGADAADFAARGCRVLAVEPSPELREPARRLRASPAIEWLDDSLPDLALLMARSEDFDAVMLTGVWMHLDADERRIAMPRLRGLLAPGGRLIMSLRHGPTPPGRVMFEVTGVETVALAQAEGLAVRVNVAADSVLTANRAAGVTWTWLVFEAP